MKRPGGEVTVVHAAPTRRECGLYSTPPAGAIRRRGALRIFHHSSRLLSVTRPPDVGAPQSHPAGSLRGEGDAPVAAPGYRSIMATEICQYCGVDLDETPPRQETGWLYGVECARCP